MQEVENRQGVFDCDSGVKENLDCELVYLVFIVRALEHVRDVAAEYVSYHVPEPEDFLRSLHDLPL